MKLIVVLFVALAAIGSIYANHYTPAWWGQNPYLAMNFFVGGAEALSTPLATGDEIGIFDGSTLVGATQLTGSVTSYPYQLVPINASMVGGGVPGSANQGHFITFRIWIASTLTEYSYPEMSVFFDDENYTDFATQGTCFINMLSYSTPAGTASQVLTPPVGPGGGYVLNTPFPEAGSVLNQIWINADGGGNVTAYSFDTPTLDCILTSTAPVFNPNYGWFIDSQNISYYATVDYPISVSFNLNGLQNIGDPASVILYRRAIHGTGAFTTIPAVYNPSTGYLTSQVTYLGEFVIGVSGAVNQTGNLVGHIYEYNTTNPITSAIVTIGTRNVPVDPTGYYSFMNLPTGNYTVQYAAGGYNTTLRNVTILEFTTHTVDVYMVPDTMIPEFPLFLTITRPADGYRLDWQISQIAQSYKIYVAEFPDMAFTYLATTDETHIFLSDSFLYTNGVNPYHSFFRVKAESLLAGY
jgi:hypothetical protein